MIRRAPGSTFFPTRRSSDLRHDHVGQQPPGRGAVEAGRGENFFRNCPDILPEQEDDECAMRDRGNDDALRSEEHTSELQSPVPIACRLLLEKEYTKLSITFI